MEVGEVGNPQAVEFLRKPLERTPKLLEPRPARLEVTPGEAGGGGGDPETAELHRAKTRVAPWTHSRFPMSRSRRSNGSQRKRRATWPSSRTRLSVPRALTRRPSGSAARFPTKEP